jgi:zinc protease
MILRHDGLTAILVRTPQPVVAVTVTYQAGVRDEHPLPHGLAHLVEHLMFHGSAGHPRGEYERAVTRAGGRLLAETRRDYSVFGQVVPSESLPAALALEAGRMADLELTRTAVDTELNVIEREYADLIESRPYGRFPRFVIADHLYDGPERTGDGYGSPSRLHALGLDEIHAHLERHYTLDRAVISVVGDVSEQLAADAVIEYFGTLPMHGAPRRDLPDVGPLESDRSIVYERPGVPNAVGLAWRMPDPATDRVAHLAAVVAFDTLCAPSGPLARVLARLAPRTRLSGWIGEYGDPFDGRCAVPLVLELHGADERVAVRVRAELAEIIDDLVPAALRRACDARRFERDRHADQPLHRSRLLGVAAALFGADEADPADARAERSANDVTALASVVEGTGCLFVHCVGSSR